MVQLQNWFYRYNAWSFTKHRMWNECKLAYYFRYIGTALRNSETLNVSELKRLKDLYSKNVLLGMLVHNTLENQINLFQDGQQPNEKLAREEFVAEWEKYRIEAQKLIIEFYNGLPLSETYFDIIRENGLDQIDLFFGVVWPLFSDLEYLRHEKFDRFHVNNEVEAIIKADFIIKSTEGTITICDWKTGIDNPEYESDLQIGAYVLWASEYFDTDPQSIKAKLIYLTTGSIRDFEFTPEQLSNIKKLILRDYNEMNRTYDIVEFAPNPDKQTCLSCYFSTVCTYSLAKELLDEKE